MLWNFFTKQPPWAAVDGLDVTFFFLLKSYKIASRNQMC
jgi:hypothetical protein